MVGVVVGVGVEAQRMGNKKKIKVNTLKRGRKSLIRNHKQQRKQDNFVIFSGQGTPPPP